MVYPRNIHPSMIIHETNKALASCPFFVFSFKKHTTKTFNKRNKIEQIFLFLNIFMLPTFKGK